MKNPLFFCFILVSLAGYAQTNKPHPILSRDIPFDENWRFIRDSIAGAEQVNYDDHTWRKVDLPHDWSVEDLPNQKPGEIIGPFDKNAVGGGATGFTMGGTGWYRKHFVTAAAWQDKLISINFDGVYMNSDVWLNGHHLGNHPYGYTPFYYNLTPWLNKPGRQNVLAVRVRNEGKTSRWYSGSGIYRHVWLTAADPLHIAPWGVAISTGSLSAAGASVGIKTEIQNEAGRPVNATFGITILSPGGKVVATTKKQLALHTGRVFVDSAMLQIAHPRLWDVKSPGLYTAVTYIHLHEHLIDVVETKFGIRTIHVDAATGLTLNGKHLLLKGGCIHHDNGLLGSATIDRAEERKIELLKQNGFNAIRTSHNPPSRQLLEACDRLGMLVIDEAFDCWERGKNPEDYHLYFKEWWKKDLDAMILRDRNHPSVIFWSIGNEVNERADSSGLRITGQLVAEVHRMDPTRPVTEAICFFWDHPGYKWDTTARAYAKLDVGGYNYQMAEYETDHQKYPERIMMGTESYPMAALQNWDMVENHPYVIGDFVWTAADYLGEASIGHSTFESKQTFKFSLGWPWFNAWCGDIDLIGNKKPQSYYRDVVWHIIPIAMAVHTPVPEGMVENVSGWGWPQELQSWTWPGMEGKLIDIKVYSRAPMVRLMLNGKTVGEQKIAAGGVTAEFKVAYEPGTLTAVNVEDGKQTAAVEFKTAGTARRILLKADRTQIKNSRNDLSYVQVEVVDDKNQVVPTADLPVKFTISGAGELAAAGSANPSEPASFHQSTATTFQGRCLAIVRPKGSAGKIILKATADGLAPGRVVINTR